jgi:hypothetical protein
VGNKAVGTRKKCRARRTIHAHTVSDFSSSSVAFSSAIPVCYFCIHHAGGNGCRGSTCEANRERIDTWRDRHLLYPPASMGSTIIDGMLLFLSCMHLSFFNCWTSWQVKDMLLHVAQAPGASRRRPKIFHSGNPSHAIHRLPPVE